jgi:hypothetical protein
LIALPPLFALVAGCGSSNSTPPERPSRAIEGHVFAGPVNGTTVKAYVYRDGRKGDLIGQAVTDATGHYSFEVKTQDGVVLLEASGGAYREEASGRDVTVPVQPVLRSLVAYANSGPASTSQLTSFTTLATGLAEHLVSQGQTPQAAMEQAFAAFNDALGLDVRAVAPLDITDGGNATGGLTPGHEYGFYEAGISQWTAEAGTRNGVAPHTQYTSLSFTALGYEDIRADGLLDGHAGGTEVAVGDIGLDVDVYRNELAIALLRVAQGAANATGLSAEQLLPAANRWNGSTATFFGGAPPVPLDATPPAIRDLSPPNNSIVCGTFTASANVSDPLLTRSVFLLDGTEIGNQGSASNPSVAINTSGFGYGNHVLELRATDLLGNPATVSHTLFFFIVFGC